MKVAVVILNYNSSADCRKCVGFLKSQTDVELELIVIDNCSRQEDFEAVKKMCDAEGCTLLASKENRGYNAGNNIGLRYAASKGYKYALIANPDMEFPQSDYVARLIALMEKMPDVMVCGSDIVSPEGIHQNPMMPDGDWRSSFGWIAGIFRKKRTDTYDFIDNYKESHYCSKVSGCCLLVRMPFLKNIGFFDEYPFLYCEEAILAKQVEKAGLRMYYTADSQAIHRHVKSAKGDPVPRFKQWRRSRIYFYKKYSKDSLWGKQISIMSISINIYITVLFLRLKKLL